MTIPTRGSCNRSLSTLCLSAVAALIAACGGAAPDPASPTPPASSDPPEQAAASETKSAADPAASEEAPPASAASTPADGGGGSLKGTLDGKPFSGTTALVRPTGKDVTVRVFDGDAACDDFSFAKKTNVMMIGPWTEGKTAPAAKLSFVTYDAEGVPFTRPFDSATITFGKKPTKDAGGTMTIDAKGEKGKVQGSVKATLCP